MLGTISRSWYRSNPSSILKLGFSFTAYSRRALKALAVRFIVRRWLISPISLSKDFSIGASSFY